MNWDWEKLQEKRQRQEKNPQLSRDEPESPLSGFFSKFFSRGISFWAVLLAVLLLWFASGIFIVNPGEIGVVTRFGKYDRQVTEGPHYRLPYPFEKAVIVNADALRTIVIGGQSSGRTQRGAAEEASMFTGDENIVHMRFNVQYNVKDVYQYLFEVKEPERTIRMAAEAAMREVVGSSHIDSILTLGRAEVQVAARQVLERTLDNYKMGVRVHAVQLLDVQPPPEVAEAFKNVASAREDRERIINEAEAYRMEVVPVATGKAVSMVNAAQAYKRQIEQAAHGEAERFLAMAAAFNNAQDVSRKRMYLDAMEKMLSAAGIEKVIISKNAKDGALPLLNLDGGQRPPSPPQGGPTR